MRRLFDGWSYVQSERDQQLVQPQFHHPTVAVYCAVGTRLLAITFDLLAAAFVTSPCDSTSLLHRHIWLRIRVMLLIMYSTVFLQVIRTNTLLWLQVSYSGRDWPRQRT